MKVVSRWTFDFSCKRTPEQYQIESLCSTQIFHQPRKDYIFDVSVFGLISHMRAFFVSMISTNSLAATSAGGKLSALCCVRVGWHALNAWPFEAWTLHMQGQWLSRSRRAWSQSMVQQKSHLIRWFSYHAHFTAAYVLSRDKPWIYSCSL